MITQKIKSFLRPRTPKAVLYAYQKLRAFPEDLPYLGSFLLHSTKTPTSFRDRFWLIFKCYQISYYIDCPHMESEIIQVMAKIFSLAPEAQCVIAEAGSYKGGSGAKLSLAAEKAGRRFFLFDSFEGIPRHDEKHDKNIFGGDAYFPPGSYKGSLEEVKKNIKTFGKIECCTFIKGWFDQTLPFFKEPVGAVYVDVDLRSSTETCIEFFYPLLVSDGAIFSQDGHLPWIVDLMKDDEFWNKKIKRARPDIKGLGRKKLLEIKKERQA